MKGKKVLDNSVGLHTVLLAGGVSPAPISSRVYLRPASILIIMKKVFQFIKGLFRLSPLLFIVSIILCGYFSMGGSFRLEFFLLIMLCRHYDYFTFKNKKLSDTIMELRLRMTGVESKLLKVADPLSDEEIDGLVGSPVMKEYRKRSSK